MKNIHPDLYNYVPKQTKERYICHAHKDLYNLLCTSMPEGKEKQDAIMLLEEAFNYGVKVTYHGASPCGFLRLNVMTEKLREYAGKEWKKDVFN